MKTAAANAVDCAAAVMAVVNGSDSSRCQQQLMVTAAMASLLPQLGPMTGWWQQHQMPMHS
jgi:hypothetical protein